MIDSYCWYLILKIMMPLEYLDSKFKDGVTGIVSEES